MMVITAGSGIEDKLIELNSKHILFCIEKYIQVLNNVKLGSDHHMMRCKVTVNFKQVN